LTDPLEIEEVVIIDPRIRVPDEIEERLKKDEEDDDEYGEEAYGEDEALGDHLDLES
jgi:hypothetical protein